MGCCQSAVLVEELWWSLKKELSRRAWMMNYDGSMQISIMNQESDWHKAHFPTFSKLYPEFIRKLFGSVTWHVLPGVEAGEFEVFCRLEPAGKRKRVMMNSIMTYEGLMWRTVQEQFRFHRTRNDLISTLLQPRGTKPRKLLMTSKIWTFSRMQKKNCRHQIWQKLRVSNILPRSYAEQRSFVLRYDCGSKLKVDQIYKECFAGWQD